MTFFSAINPQLAASLDPNGVDAPAGCGPYYIAARTANKSITVKRNPYYKGPRPHNVNEIDYKIGNTLDVIQQNVESGTTDYAAQGLNPQSWAPLAAKYGVNKSRVWIKPYLGVRYLAMNNDRPLIKDNLPLRQAVNWAIDRRALINQGGFGSGDRSVQILPPGMNGYRPCKTGPAPCYPINVTAATVKKAQALAKGHTGDGKAVLCTSNRGAAPLQAQIYQFNLKQIGLDVEVDQFARAVQIEKEGTQGAPFDFTTEGWVADYADPFDFINVLLSGDNIHASNNNNVAYFNDPKYNKAMARPRGSRATRATTRMALSTSTSRRTRLRGQPVRRSTTRSSCRLAPVASRSTRSSPSTSRRSASSNAALTDTSVAPALAGATLVISGL